MLSQILIISLVVFIVLVIVAKICITMLCSRYWGYAYQCPRCKRVSYHEPNIKSFDIVKVFTEQINDLCSLCGCKKTIQGFKIMKLTLNGWIDVKEPTANAWQVYFYGSYIKVVNTTDQDMPEICVANDIDTLVKNTKDTANAVTVNDLIILMNSLADYLNNPDSPLPPLLSVDDWCTDISTCVSFIALQNGIHLCVYAPRIFTGQCVNYKNVTHISTHKTVVEFSHIVDILTEGCPEDVVS